MVATMAPKCHTVLDRVVDRYVIVIKWIGTNRSVPESFLLRAEKVEVPPKTKIELSVKPKRTVKLELR